jgi:hypothetical protein
VSRAAAAIALWTALVAAGSAQAASARRIAVLIGANEGAPAEQLLRYAEQDAAKLGAVLTELGGVAAEDLLLLKGPSLTAVRAAFDEARRRIAAAPEARTVLIVFFSGHSDGVALELGAERLTFSELKRAMEQTQATVRLAIIDSCRSGALLAAKGGRPGASFELRLAADDNSAGTVLLTSSAADEQALESREIRGSFFTHHLVSALRGAADASGEGRVTLTKAYEYAYARTVRATADTLAGPQHPSFGYRLQGQGDLVLTELSSRSAALVLPEGLERAIAIDQRRDQVVAEVAAGEGRRLALAPGDYAVRVWRWGAVAEAAVSLGPSSEVQLDPASLQPVEVKRLARKGSESAPAAMAEPSNLVSFDPVFLAVQTLSAHYQRALTPSWSATLKLRAGLLPHSSPALKLLGGGPDTSVLGTALSASWYPGGDALRGLFLGPSVDLFRVAAGGVPEGVLVASVELGHAWIWSNGLALSLSGGAQYGWAFAGQLLGSGPQLGFFPRLALHLGYAW